MNPWENFRLVLGYLPYIDRIPDGARRLGLLHRVAAVLNDDDAPHSQLYWDLVEVLAQTLAEDSVLFEIDSECGPLVFTSVPSMRQYVDGREREFGRPFDRATFFQRGRPTSFVNVEPWAAVGGPSPYSDSWTFAVYRDTDDVASIREACCRVCSRHGWPVLEEICGQAAPEDAPWWSRLTQWFLRP